MQNVSSYESKNKLYRKNTRHNLLAKFPHYFQPRKEVAIVPNNDLYVQEGEVIKLHIPNINENVESCILKKVNNFK